MKKIDFYFDFASPNGYLSLQALKKYQAEMDLEINYIPVLLGGIFKLTNNQPPMIAFGEVKGKLEYENLEMKRFIDFHQLSNFKMNPHFPVITLMLMRGALAAQQEGFLEEYINKMSVEMWENEKKLDDPDELKAAYDNAGFDSEKIFSLMGAQEIKDKLLNNSSAAAERGVFGIPTFFVGDEMYFGKNTIEEIIKRF
ncbi:2-hydroxychromene-2-carboxylate isomerase [SAR86 cluster bacterium]|nr:2-hydroxychromene-2-carboxylate isomerase [SAR86 cluster bacterium]